MKFLVDRCAGRRLADWLRQGGHDVVYLDSDRDPGDRHLLQMAYEQQRILITLDHDFGELVFHHELSHWGMVRLPDVPVSRRIELMTVLMQFHADALASRGIIAVRGTRIRIVLPKDKIQ